MVPPSKRCFTLMGWWKEMRVCDLALSMSCDRSRSKLRWVLCVSLPDRAGSGRSGLAGTMQANVAWSLRVALYAGRRRAKQGQLQ
jgi:hypothetical protein